MKRRRFNQIGNKVQRWNDEHCEVLELNLYHIIGFEIEPEELSPKGRAENRKKLAQASSNIKVSIEELKEWFKIFERRERKRQELSLEHFVANGELTPEQARELRNTD